MSKVNPKIFRSYDIRGIYPDDLNEDIASRIGSVLAELIKEKFPDVERPKAVVGRDMRLGSPGLHKALVMSLTEAGVAVDDIGLVPVDAVYFAVGKFEYELGVMITASHNPREYAGMKMVMKGMNWLRGVDIKDKVLNFKQGDEAKETGEVKEHDIWPDYIKHVHSFVDLEKIKPLKVVVDAGNGMAAEAIPRLLAGLPVELKKMNFTLDGNFPAHPSNPLAPGAADELKKKVVSEKADLGVIFDGDTDRLMFIDETGRMIQADTGLAVLAKFFLDKEPGKGVAYNVICSKAVPEIVEKLGGQAIRTAVGYVNVAKGAEDNDGILGGEVSAHYSFRDNYYADSGMIAFMVMLQLVSESGQKFSELVEEFILYCRGDEVNLEIEDSEAVISKIKEHYADASLVDELDGVTIEYKDWWFNVRPSNTEPLLRITVEADTCEEMEEKRAALVEFVKSVS